MAVPFFDLGRQSAALEAELSEAIRRVVNSQGFIMGPEVSAFEDQISQLIGADRAIACASGTDALLLPLLALEAERGDEVIVPGFTFFASAGAVWNAGFRPVFCDVDEATFNVHAEAIETCVTPRTRAVVVVHLFGQMAPMGEITKLAARHGLVVIEDVAQAMGAWQEVDGDRRAAGSIGHAGAFSFFPTKNLGAFGDAGLITGQDESVAERVSVLRTHGGRRMYHHEYVGTNSRLDALQAAILRVKLPHLNGFVEQRRANAASYGLRLRNVDEVSLPTETSGNYHTFNQYTVRTSSRDELRGSLTQCEIGSKVYYPRPLHLQPCFSELGYAPGALPVCERLCDEVLSLPVFPEITEDEIDSVAMAVRRFFGA